VANANEDTVRRVFQVICAQDKDTLHSLLTDDVRLHYPGHGRLAGDYQGINAVEDFMHRQTTNTKLHIMNAGVFADDERAVLLFVQDVQHGHRTVHERGVAVFSFRGGRVSEVWITPMDLETSDQHWSASSAA